MRKALWDASVGRHFKDLRIRTTVGPFTSSLPPPTLRMLPSDDQEETVSL